MVRFRTAFLSAVVLLAFTAPVNFLSAAASNGQYIKVGIAYGSGAVSSCSLKCEEGFVLARAVSRSLEEISTFTEISELTVKPESSYITARDSSGQAVYENFDGDICVLPVDHGSGGLIYYNGKPYRGGFCFDITAGGKMDVINYIDIESYLCGVLNAEMWHESPMEALKAQAVTARSFAMCNAGKHKAEGFDLCSDVHCQMYAGYSGEFPETNQAVDETAGLILTYGAEAVSGYYFKNSGGHTQSVSDVWNDSEPYLIGVKDDYSPDYPWNYEISFQEAGSKLQAAGYNIGKIKSVEIKSRNSSGAVSALEINGTAGTAELSGENVRVVFGSANVKSMMFSFGGEREQGGSADLKPTLSNGKDSEFPGGDDIVHVISSGGAVEEMKLKDIYVYPGKLLTQLTDSAVKESKAEIVANEPLVFYGAGYGHGVGMPQDSAIVMAERGFTYEEILKYYFTGIEIQ